MSMIEKAAAKRKPIRRVTFLGDAAWRQTLPPEPDDTSSQNPDFLFLAQLAQVCEAEAHEPIRKVLYRVAGPVRNTENVAINKTVFFRPEETEFVLVEHEDGMRYFERFEPKRHGEWDQIEDMGMTPQGCINDIYRHGEQYPAIIRQFTNERKKEGGASKTHWQPGLHPTPKKR